MHSETLPRDVWIAVVAKMDMDTRIKCGIVFKLRVPEKVATLIADVCLVCVRKRVCVTGTKLSLGPYRVWNTIRMPMYSIIYDIIRSNNFFSVINCDSDQLLSFSLYAETNKWIPGFHI